MTDFTRGELLHLALLDKGVPRVLRVRYHGPAPQPIDPDDRRAFFVTIYVASGLGFKYTDVPPENLFKLEEDAWEAARGLKDER